MELNESRFLRTLEIHDEPISSAQFPNAQVLKEQNRPLKSFLSFICLSRNIMMTLHELICMALTILHANVGKIRHSLSGT
jgi:hypothetical protein